MPKFHQPSLAELVPLQGAKEILQSGHGYFSTTGEDLTITKLLANETTQGVFVDIGAHHPFRHSNTFVLYMHGWRGINVDASEESITLFNEIRREDTNIRALVSDKIETLTYYSFDRSALNTTNPEAIAFYQDRKDEVTLMNEEKMQTVPINAILETYVRDKKFDFLNIDVEGMDTRLFQAIDFSRFRPKVISIEWTIDVWNSDPIRSYLKEIGYSPKAQLLQSAILLRNDQ